MSCFHFCIIPAVRGEGGGGGMLEIYCRQKWQCNIIYQRTIGPVNAHLISWPSKAQSIQNLENIW